MKLEIPHGEHKTYPHGGIKVSIWDSLQERIKGPPPNTHPYFLITSTCLYLAGKDAEIYHLIFVFEEFSIMVISLEAG